MTVEQLVLVAREFCAAYGTRITDYSALCAASAASLARIEGIAVHSSREQAAAAMERVLHQLQPLDGRNREFAALCRRVMNTADSPW